MTAKVVNFVVFQVVYSACVLGAARGWLWLGPVAGAVLLPINLLFVPKGRRLCELRLWAICGALGFTLDSGLLASGLIDFPSIARVMPEAAASGWLVPPWIVTLWIAVGTMLRTTLGWLAERRLLAVALGAVGGPLSFWSGSRLGAVELPAGWLTLGALSLEYALVMPVLLRLAYPVGTPAALPNDDATST